jgi:hypothetical protein
MMATMGRMTDMMGQMSPMMGNGMMGATMSISGTMPMSGTMPISGIMPMGTMGDGMMGAEQMAQMMAMMGPMMQMMGQMHASMAGGMMGADMMGETMAISGTMPMSGTMPISGTMPMGTMGDGMMGDGMMDAEQMAEMMAMMGPMMQMMGQMHASMADGMMGGSTSIMGTELMTKTTPVTTEAAAFDPQSAEDGGVTVEVTPLTLGDDEAESLDFQVSLNTHTVELDQDLADLAVLQVDGAEFVASGWDGSLGGHHISGVLSFAALDEDGEPILQDAGRISLVIRDLAGVDERTFTWDVSE